MVHFPTLVAASFAVVTTTAAYAHAAPAATPNVLIVQAGTPLTITAAKHKVTDWLSATGFGRLHTGEAEFDRQGNVKVEVLNPTGTPYTHVLVHANDGSITDARAGAANSNKG